MEEHSLNTNSYPLLGVLGAHVDADVTRSLRAKYALEKDCVSGSIYCENEELGVALGCDGEVVSAIFLFGEGKDGYCQFTGVLPCKLDFDMKRADVLRTMVVPPSASGESERIAKGVSHGGWDRFDLGEFSIHITYAEAMRTVELVTISSCSKTPPNCKPL